jgi:hypothetical protein
MALHQGKALISIDHQYMTNKEQIDVLGAPNTNTK